MPRLLTVPERPVGALRQVHRERGIEIDAQTAMPTWDGRGFDLHWAGQVTSS